MIGRLAAAVVEGFKNPDPYSDSAAYFDAVADVAVERFEVTTMKCPRPPWARLFSKTSPKAPHSTLTKTRYSP